MSASSILGDGNAIHLREINRDNVLDILRLQVHPDQAGLVANNAKSLAQAYVYEEAWVRGVYHGDTPVGFVMLELQPDTPEYCIWRFMIDGQHQRKGYGREAVELAVDHIQTLPNAAEVLLSHVQAEGSAGPFYESCGFEYTGEILGGEHIMRRAL